MTLAVMHQKLVIININHIIAIMSTTTNINLTSMIQKTLHQHNRLPLKSLGLTGISTAIIHFHLHRQVLSFRYLCQRHHHPSFNNNI
jgi:hypothetical protein